MTRMIQSSKGIQHLEPSATRQPSMMQMSFVYHHGLESWAEFNPQSQNSKVQVLEASQGMEFDRVVGLEDVQGRGG